MRPPPEEGASRLPNTGSASAYPCAEDIIARFVEFGKVRNCLPPPRGKVPPQGADEGNAEGLEAVAWESSSHRLAAMRRTFPAKEKGLSAAADRPSG